MASSSSSSQSETNNNSNNNNLFSRALFGARFPAPAIVRSSRINPYRSAQTQRFSWTNNDEVAVLNEPLSRGQKMMLEDVFISDASVRRGVTLFAKFLLGKRTRTTVDINKEFMTAEMQEQALSNTFNEKEVDELRTMIDKVNRQVHFRDKIEAVVVQALVGGRSALMVERQGEMPIDLKVLNWGKLGRVFADKDTWQLLAVEYADRPKDKPLLAEELLYFSWMDYNIAPDSLYHGLSAIQPLADISETIRLISSEDLKESARSAWASSGLIKFPPNTSQSKMTDFVKDYSVGTWNATSQGVEVETHDLDPKLEAMVNVITEGQRMIQRGLGIPSFLMGFEQVTNRATSELVMHSWRESDLNHARSWLQGILEPQWFDSLIKIRFPDVDIADMWIKAKLEFEDVTLESLKDRAETVIPLFQAGIIPLEKALKILDMEDVLEQMLAEQKKREKQRAQELEMMKLEREQQQGNRDVRGDDEEEEEDGEEEEEELQAKFRKAAEEQLRQASLVRQQQQQRDEMEIKKLAQEEHRHKIEAMEKMKALTEKLDKRLAYFASTE